MCEYCGDPLDRDRKPGFNETCASCGHDLHTCLNCRFHRPGLRWDCAETVDASVPDKDRRNHCDWFSVAPALFVKTEGRLKDRLGAEAARKGFGSLFGGNV